MLECYHQAAEKAEGRKRSRRARLAALVGQPETMSTSRQALGQWGESLAAHYLQQRGYTILARNVRTAYGEIDLVARQLEPPAAVTVFVEVKTRPFASLRASRRVDHARANRPTCWRLPRPICKIIPNWTATGAWM